MHYNVDNGNVTDDQTHVQTWDVLRRIVGRAKFVYVADSKLCTKHNMGYIGRPQGWFITVLPQTRKEDARFKKWILDNTGNWQVIWNRPHRRGGKKVPPEIFEALDAPEPSAEGYRIVWYRTSEKWKRDQQERDDAIQAARMELQRLSERVSKRFLKTRAQVQEAVAKILDDTHTHAWDQGHSALPRGTGVSGPDRGQDPRPLRTHTSPPPSQRWSPRQDLLGRVERTATNCLGPPGDPSLCLWRMKFCPIHKFH